MKIGNQIQNEIKIMKIKKRNDRAQKKHYWLNVY